MSIGLFCRRLLPNKTIISGLPASLSVNPRDALRCRHHVHSFQQFERNFSSAPLRSFSIKRYVLYGIIGANLATFVTWRIALSKARDGGDFSLLHCMERNFALSYSNLSAGRYWTIITCAFSHAQLGHFLGNMIGFRTFWTIAAAAPQVTVASLVILASGSAIAGNAAWLWYERSRPRNSAALGASGMVMGMGAAAACISPFTRVGFIFIPISIPLWAAVGVYLFYDSYYLQDSTSRIGHSAHLGGSAFGIIYALTRL